MRIVLCADAVGRDGRNDDDDNEDGDEEEDTETSLQISSKGVTMCIVGSGVVFFCSGLSVTPVGVVNCLRGFEWC